MLLRRLLAAVSLGAVTLGATPLVAGAAGPGISVPTTTIEAGGSLAVTVTEPCTAGEWGYGSVNQYIDGWYDLAGKPGEITQRTYKRDTFTGYSSNVIEFPKPGTYTLRNYCGDVEVGSLVITVTEKATTTTTTTSTTTSTTVAPTSSTTAAPTSTTTTAAPRSTTTAPAVVAGVTTTTTPQVAVAGSTLTRTTPASGATASATRGVSYAG